jgi:hypothetical protein
MIAGRGSQAPFAADADRVDIHVDTAVEVTLAAS